MCKSQADLKVYSEGTDRLHLSHAGSQDTVHSDVWGPANPQSYNRKLYYVSFTDDYTRWTTVYCIGQKLEVFQKYKEYEALLKTQHGNQIKLLQWDQGGEFLSNEFTNHLKKNGTL